MNAIKFEKRGQQAWITLNRPEYKNTINGDMFVELADAWEEVRNDSDIRVAVLTATGEQDFCCGGDLGALIPLWTGAKQPENAVEERLLADPFIADKVMMKGEPLLKPVIAAINGRALGGGTELLQATDIRIAADHATFALPEPLSGVVPGAGSMVRLARQLPYAHAMKILLGGEPVTAQEALAMGLVSEVVPLAQLQERAQQFADNVCRQAPLAGRYASKHSRRMCFSILPLPHILSCGLRRIATSMKFLSRKGTRPSTPQAANDLFALKQSYKCNFPSFLIVSLRKCKRKLKIEGTSGQL